MLNALLIVEENCWLSQKAKSHLLFIAKSSLLLLSGSIKRLYSLQPGHFTSHVKVCETDPLLSSKLPISHQVNLIGKVHGHSQLDQQINAEAVATLGYNWASCNKTSQ